MAKGGCPGEGARENPISMGTHMFGSIPTPPVTPLDFPSDNPANTALGLVGYLRSQVPYPVFLKRKLLLYAGQIFCEMGFCPFPGRN